MIFLIVEKGRVSVFKECRNCWGKYVVEESYIFEYIWSINWFLCGKIILYWEGSKYCGFGRVWGW